MRDSISSMRETFPPTKPSILIPSPGHKKYHDRPEKRWWWGSGQDSAAGDLLLGKVIFFDEGVFAAVLSIVCVGFEGDRMLWVVTLSASVSGFEVDRNVGYN